MRKILLFLLFALPFVANGQNTGFQMREELHLVDKLFYDRDVYTASAKELDKLHDLVVEMRVDTTLKINIVGYGDKWGGVAINDRFSYVRAMYVADWIYLNGVPRKQIAFVGCGIDSSATNDMEARRVDVLRIANVAVEPQEPADIEPKPTQAAKPVHTPATTGAIDTPATAEPASPCSKFSLRTNLLYWLTGMANVGFEWQPAETQLGVILNGGYSPIGGKNAAHAIGGWYISPELRYYFPANEKWFIGAQFLAQEYNFKLSKTGYQGSLIGGGIMGGYKLRLTDIFDMDFTLGVGYGTFKYDKYYHSCGVNVLEEGGIKKSGITPIQAGVNLIWKIK